MISEGKFQATLAKELRMLPRCVVLNKVGNYLEGEGWPDLYVAEPRWTGWLELKVKARVTDAQRDRIMMLRRANVDARILKLKRADSGKLIEVYEDDNGRDLGCFHPLNDDYKHPSPHRAVRRLEWLSRKS